MSGVAFESGLTDHEGFPGPRVHSVQVGTFHVLSAPATPSPKDGRYPGSSPV